MSCNTNHEEKLKQLKKFIKVRGMIASKDNGKTWFICRQDYVVHAKKEHQKKQFGHAYARIEVNLEGLPLKTDFEYMRE